VACRSSAGTWGRTSRAGSAAGSNQLAQGATEEEPLLRSAAVSSGAPGRSPLCLYLYHCLSVHAVSPWDRMFIRHEPAVAPREGPQGPGVRCNEKSGRRLHPAAGRQGEREGSRI